jgi:translocation and assembly module TamB
MRRRTIIGGALAVIAILIITAIAGGYFFLTSQRFQRLAIRTIVKDTNEATGGRAELGRLDLQLSTLTAHFYDITLHGSELSNQPPLLHVDKLTVGIKIQSFLHRKFTLSQLLIEHPIAQVRVDRQGKSNLPLQSSRAQSSGNISVFDLAAQHVVLTDGQVHYNDKTIPLDAELSGLTTGIHFVPAETRYRGSIAYASGWVRYANNPACAHSLEARFSAVPTGFSLESAVLKVRSSELSLQAELSDYNHPTVEGRYDLRIHTQDFSGILQSVRATGDVLLSGTVHYRGEDNGQPLRNISLDGQMASDQLGASSPAGRLDLRRMQARYQLRDGNFRARDVAFETLGGKVTAEIELQHLDTTAAGQVRVALQGISLAAAQQGVRTAEGKQFGLAGGVTGVVSASWAGSFRNVLARADVTVKAASNDAARPRLKALPVNGSVHALYDAARDTVSFRDTSLGIPSATISAQGDLSRHSKLQLQVEAGDLHTLANLMSAFGSQSGALEVAGSATLRALVQGSMQTPQMTGQFDARNLRVQGSEWSSAKFAIAVSSSRIAVHDAVLVNAHQGKASLNANLALRDWSYRPSGEATLSLSVHRMAIADLQRLANTHYPVSGDVSADVSFHGSELNPAGNGSARIEDARAYDEPIHHLSATFRADKNSVTSTLEVSLPAGSANGTFSYTPQTKAYIVRLNAPSVALQKLQMVQAKNLGLSGTLSISADGSGTLDNPQLTATVQVPQLGLRDKSISQITAQLQVANQQANLMLDSQFAQASVHSHAKINLTGDHYTEAALDTGVVQIDSLFALYMPGTAQIPHGQTEVHATLKGPLNDRSRIEAHLSIPTFKASYQSLEIGAAAPIRVDYSNSAITLQPAEIQGTGTSLRLQGSFPLAGTTVPSLTAQGRVDVRILRLMDPDLQSSGTLSFDVRASGTPQEPVVRGQIHVQEVALSTMTAPLGVQKLNGTLDVSDRRVQFSSLTGEVGGGQVSMGGAISYRPDLQFSVSVQGRSVRLRYPDGVRALLDGNLAWSGTKEASMLNGRVLIDTISFTPDFDLTKFTDQFSGNVAPSEPGLADNVKLAVTVQSKSDLSATSSQVSLEGQMNLQVLGTAANPVVIGRTDLTSGELFYRNVRYQLQRGIISFDNPNETEPVLNISATTTVEQYNLTLTLRGPFDKLTTAYTSDPPLATADIINLIANGQTTQEASAAGQSTDSILASQATSQVTGGIQHLAGISSLQIDPLLGGNNQNPSARVAIQQRVTRNFLFTFSTDLSQPGSEIVQGDYQINKRWSVSVTRDEVGGVSVDGKYHTKF